MIWNSLICKLINVQACMKENNEKKVKNSKENSKLIKAFPKLWKKKEDLKIETKELWEGYNSECKQKKMEKRKERLRMWSLMSKGNVGTAVGSLLS